MATNIINASPTKDFFISMLVKDIGLSRAIIDLVDNSIDGARRLRGEDDFYGLEIKIKLSEDAFEISDNCGGIDLDIAQNYAFRFGRPSGFEKTPNSVGLFGVGMKRAIFKMGSKFIVDSTTVTSKFKIVEDINEWKKDDKWEFTLEILEDYANKELTEETGTTIIVKDLHESVRQDFRSETFQKRVFSEIEEAQHESLEKGIRIKLNDIVMRPRELSFLESESMKPAHKIINLGSDGKEIFAKIYSGVYDPNPADAGWYVFCNGRLILGADQTFLTGWGEGNSRTIPKYHNDFARFRGYVFFYSKDASLLPWNTTKTGVDVDSPIYRNIRNQMITLMKPVIVFLRQLSNERSNNELDERPLQNAIDASVSKSISLLEENNVFTMPSPIQKRKSTTVSIQYNRPINKVKTVKELLGITSNKEVGEATFDYFWARECDN